MNPISLISNHNPKNQLSFLPFKREHLNDKIQPKEIKLEQSSSTTRSSDQIRDLTFYEQEVTRLTYMNTIITAQLSSAIEEKKIIMRLINQAQKREFEQQQSDKQKRVRRCAKDIQRKFKCTSQGCEKSYGTEGSLLQHIRLKHPQMNSHDPPLLLDPA